MNITSKLIIPKLDKVYRSRFNLNRGIEILIDVS